MRLSSSKRSSTCGFTGSETGGLAVTTGGGGLSIGSFATAGGISGTGVLETGGGEVVSEGTGVEGTDVGGTWTGGFAVVAGALVPPRDGGAPRLPLAVVGGSTGAGDGGLTAALGGMAVAVGGGFAPAGI